MTLRPCVFLDRDGTMNVEKDYVYRIEDWEWIPGAREAVRALNEMGFVVVVVTNQSGVARGFYGEADVKKLHDWVASSLKEKGARVDAFHYCPHHPDHGEKRECDCRKPKPGLLLKAARELGLDLGRSFLVGDKAVDVECARAAGVAPILVSTGYGARAKQDAGDALRAADLPAAVELIRRRTK